MVVIMWSLTLMFSGFWICDTKHSGSDDWDGCWWGDGDHSTSNTHFHSTASHNGHGITTTELLHLCSCHFMILISICQSINIRLLPGEIYPADTSATEKFMLAGLLPPLFLFFLISFIDFFYDRYVGCYLNEWPFVSFQHLFRLSYKHLFRHTLKMFKNNLSDVDG